MYCPKCGAQVPESKKHRTRCGSSLADAQPHPADSGRLPDSRSMPYQPVEPKSTFLDKWFDPKTPSPRQTAPASKQSYNFIWFALFMSLHMYLVFSYLLDLQNRLSARPAAILPVLPGIALVVLIFGITIIKLQITPGKVNKYSSAQDAMRHVHTFGIIGMAQIESVAAFGIILVVLGHSVFYFYAFFAVSAIAMIISRIMVEPTWLFIENNPTWNIQA